MQKVVNPFYAALVVVGLAFAVTTCAYTVMSFRQLDPNSADEPGVSALLEHQGVTILVVELALLSVLTVAAIGTDAYWTRRAGK